MAGRFTSFIPCALLAGALGTAHAAELGEARVASFIGQPLVADIELTTLDAPATPVAARLAHPNVYRGGNIGMPHVLSTLTMTVMRKGDRQFLHVTSLAPVESSHLHLYLELLDGAQRNVRLVTLTLAPDPHPAPKPAPVIAPAPQTVAAPPVEAPRPGAPVALAPKPKPAPRPVMAQPTKPEPTPAPKAAPKPKVTLPALPIAAPAVATCASGPAGQPSLCAALDVKNAQLRQQIGALEDKVRVLQVAMGAKPSEVSAPLPAPKAHPIRKKPAPPPQEPPHDDLPWGPIGAAAAALLALAGGLLLLLRRRRNKGALRPVGEPRIPVMDRLRRRFARNKATPPTVEPRLEEDAHELSTQDR